MQPYRYLLKKSINQSAESVPNWIYTVFYFNIICFKQCKLIAGDPCIVYAMCPDLFIEVTLGAIKKYILNLMINYIMYEPTKL